jgi:predicted DCC family thiol-disulfide oxidoreductase YuxK
MDSRNEIASTPVILFDGVCNLCNSSVQFIIKRDPKSIFRFASIQSDAGRELLTTHGEDPDALASVILIREGKVYKRSAAALEIARRLSGAWPLFYAFRIFPSAFLDIFYNLIARNRYRWFGRQDECMIPDGNLSLRFLD